MKKDGESIIGEKGASSFEVLRNTGIAIDKSNPESQEILALINRSKTGKIPFSQFMDKSLYGQYGYYSSGKVEIGSSNMDFTTATERSMLFGASIGDEMIRIWKAMGAPEDFSVVEMGAGEGGMAESVLEYIKIKSPELFEKMRYNILDLGRELIPRQKERLSQTGKDISWVYGSATELPFAHVNGVFLSNELPDAFPVEQIVRNQNGDLGQVFVGVDVDNNWTEYWGEMSPEVKQYVEDHDIQVGYNDYVAVNLLATKFQENISQALDRGAIITFDYGGLGQSEKDKDVRSYAKDHIRKGEVSRENWKYKNVGEVDITADVNFKVLEEVSKANGLEIAYSGKQGDMIQAIDIDETMRWLVANYKKLSWKQIEKVSKSISDFGLFHLNFYNFYGHVLVKGLEPASILPTLSGAEKALDFEIKFPVKGAKPRNRVRIERIKKDGSPDAEYKVVENDGTILIEPRFLRGSKFIKERDVYDEEPVTFYDFTKDEDLYAVLKSLGIKTNQ